MNTYTWSSMAAPKTFKEFVVLVSIVAGIIVPAIGFLLYFTDRGSPMAFASIAFIVALQLGILFWFGVGLVGILRMIGTALIVSGLVCLLPKPLAGIVCLVIGFTSHCAAFQMAGNANNGSRKL
jgi:hypothetical protein